MITFASFIYDLVKTTIALFVVVDPIGMVPIVLSLTKDMDPAVRWGHFRTATYTGSVLLVVFSLTGQELLMLFGISLYSFMIAGGILLLLIAINILLHGETTAKIGAPEDVGAVPIAFPLLVGPGAITTAIVTLAASGLLVAIPAIILVMYTTWVVLKFADKVYASLGRTGSAVISRLMAVFLAAIAVQYVLTGIRFYYP